MFDLFLIFFAIYALFVVVIILLGFYLQRGKEESHKGERLNARQITVIVPFRNEEHRIEGIIESINQLQKQPEKWIFVDDHSDDLGGSLIRDKIEVNNYELIRSPDYVKGKKEAIRFGTKQASTDFILTMDADVNFSSTYFVEMEKLDKADMHVLPVIMQPKSTFQSLYEVDLMLVTAANCGLAGLTRPIMASGANLLYRRDVFVDVDDYESHAHMASGDDTYLLRDFRMNNKNVRLQTNPAIAIRTETPQSFSEFISQRLRWIGKTGDLKDNLSTTLAVIQALLTFMFFVFVIYFATIGQWELMLAAFGIKAVIDMICFAPFFFRLKRFGTWGLLPIYELLYPIYVLIIGTLLTIHTPSWKGREIVNK